ncbi:restriction endonuclease subunit S [Sphingomonas sp. PB4P5]|uniref:restriction endonuclease subunit S n=1 Tax=Parasphingomonas puruogangriensis TaxID=3096155 RepID=UPI002FC74EE2
MNAALLLEQYARIADAPDAIARLRRFVLDLAVRGKLVEQDAGDEPAAELLKRIAAEKAKLRLKAPANHHDIDEPPFQLRTGWHWTAVGEICSKTGSGSTPRGGKEVYKSSGIPFLRSQNVYDDGLRLDDVAFIDAATHQRMGSTKVLARDLLLNITGGSMGRCCRVPDDFDEANVSQHVAILRLAVCGTEDFLHLLVRSPYFQAFIFEEQTGAGRGGLPKNRMDNIAVALPPLAEQHRIVAKVDELMALCDQLEAARVSREAARDTFTLSTLAKLNTPDRKTFDQEARFALANLAPLTTRPDQIKQLRQTILNLAVRGKLVEQDASEEPALAYLSRLQDAPLAAKKLQKSVQVDEDHHRLPDNWAWLPLGALIRGMDAGWSPQCENHPRTDESQWGVLKTTAVQALSFDPSQHKLLPSKLSPRHAMQAEVGDVLVTRAGPKNRVGVSCVVDTPCPRLMISDKLIRFHGLGDLSAEYLALTLNAGDSLRQLEDAKSGMAVMQMNISQDKLRAVLVPLPPVAEQWRIVGTVNELIAMCDQLEASITMGEQTRSCLLEAVLHNALEPA